MRSPLRRTYSGVAHGVGPDRPTDLLVPRVQVLLESPDLEARPEEPVPEAAAVHPVQHARQGRPAVVMPGGGAGAAQGGRLAHGRRQRGATLERACCNQRTN
jgi:hypothetical protein